MIEDCRLRSEDFAIRRPQFTRKSQKYEEKDCAIVTVRFRGRLAGWLIQAQASEFSLPSNPSVARILRFPPRAPTLLVSTSTDTDSDIKKNDEIGQSEKSRLYLWLQMA